MSGTTIAHAASPRGELLLRRRDDGALELRVNGVFVMDTMETSTERALARLAVEAVADAEGHGVTRTVPVAVLVGGLGLGYTLRELASFPFIDEILVVEIEGALIGWHRAGLVPPTAQLLRQTLLRETRVVIVEADVRAIVKSSVRASFDAIILDVDNGPGFLVYDDNADVYRPSFLASCSRALKNGGRLVVWSAAEAGDLERTLRQVFHSVRHHTTDVLLGTRPEAYHAYVAWKEEADVELCPVP